jgi:hypothetical protein
MHRLPTLLRSVVAASLALAVALGAAGCDSASGFDGPLLVDRFGDFSLLDPLSASASSVDFAAGEAIAFSARFNKQTDWVLEIVGEQSGAVKRIEGFSNELTAENATWRGGTTELPLFKDEPVTASLFFPDETDTDTTRADVAVLSARDYPGVVLADFEGGDEIQVGNFEFELQNSGISAEVPPGQGDGFYLLRGTEPPSGPTRNFFVGLIDIRPEGRGLVDVPTTVPEDLHLNFFLRGFDAAFTIAVVQLVVDGNDTGAYEVDQDVIFPFGDLPVDFEGWQFFSKPVSELGVTQEQAGDIVGVRVVLISDNSAQPATPQQVAFGIDYITFTGSGPLEL